MVALRSMFGPGSNREPVFPSYRGQPPLPAITLENGPGRSRRDYPMFCANGMRKNKDLKREE
ncbi:hypothetical protein ELG74_05825 [Rhizobium leguminosarum]|nr:hypothetical protein ELG74_05825 [Rhizobium leguminosarum]